MRSVAQWLGTVCRTPHRTPVPAVAIQAPVTALVVTPPPTQLFEFDTIARDIWDNTLTQRDSCGVALGPTRDAVLFELDRVHYLADALRPRSPKRARE